MRCLGCIPRFGDRDSLVGCGTCSRTEYEVRIITSTLLVSERQVSHGPDAPLKRYLSRWDTCDATRPSSIQCRAVLAHLLLHASPVLCTSYLLSRTVLLVGATRSGSTSPRPTTWSPSPSRTRLAFSRASLGAQTLPLHNSSPVYLSSPPTPEPRRLASKIIARKLEPLAAQKRLLWPPLTPPSFPVFAAASA